MKTGWERLSARHEPADFLGAYAQHFDTVEVDSTYYRPLMAHSEDLRKRVVEAVFRDGMSRNAAAERFDVSIASAVRWAHRFLSTGEMTPALTGGNRRSDRIEAHRDYLLGSVRRQPDITLRKIQERLIADCGERF